MSTTDGNVPHSQEVRPKDHAWHILGLNVVMLINIKTDAIAEFYSGVHQGPVLPMPASLDRSPWTWDFLSYENHFWNLSADVTAQRILRQLLLRLQAGDFGLS